jgi:hypothetical protein
MASVQLNLLCNKSRMMGDYHVRIRERFGGETPPYLLDLLRTQDIKVESFVNQLKAF